ncbi:MAG: hypothetical protein AAGH70_01905 [Pseudomonadota bacterium]
MLGLAAKHGRWCLVAGLVAGLTLPVLADAMRPFLPPLIAALLFLSAFRVGPEAIWQGLRSDFSVFGVVFLFQIAAPLTVLGGAYLLGVSGTTAALAAVLMLCAPSVTGSPNFAMIMGVKPEAALRLLMVGTALFPVTVLPVLFFLPALDTAGVLSAAGKLVAVILVAGGAALLLRQRWWQTLSASQEQQLDGLSAILLGIVVIGLMSAAGPMLAGEPLIFTAWLIFATVLNFSCQLLVWRGGRRMIPPQDRPSISIVAGNRNVALFLVALPPDITFGLLSFIGCYQIPMYLTPILFQRLYGPMRPETE